MIVKKSLIIKLNFLEEANAYTDLIAYYHEENRFYLKSTFLVDMITKTPYRFNTISIALTKNFNESTNG